MLNWIVLPIQPSPRAGTGIVIAAVLAAAFYPGARAQDAPAKVSAKETPKESQNQAKGLAPRLTPGDYPARAQLGPITIAAEFMSHGVPNAEAILSTEDYVVVEVGFFGPPGSRITLTGDEFNLRLNKKKQLLPEQPYSMIFGSLKDPEWEPPDPPAPKAGSTSLGGGSQPDAPPPVPKPPMALQRAWHTRVEKAAMPEGERPLPSAGIVFFKHTGKTEKLDSIELLYAGSAGKVTLTLR